MYETYISGMTNISVYNLVYRMQIKEIKVPLLTISLPNKFKSLWPLRSVK